MTYQGNPRNALEAVLAAGRAAFPVAPTSDSPHKAGAPTQRRPHVALDRAAVTLLARVLVYRPAQGVPIIQLAGCAPGERPGAVAATLAQTCAVLVGRTLMVEVERPHSGLLMPPTPAVPLPDAFLTSLYHYTIGSAAADADLLYGAARAQAWAVLTNPFRILVIEAPGPCSGAALALAPLCSCTVLVVQAGRTPLAAVRAAATSVTQAGGRVVGTVLAGAARRDALISVSHR